VFVVVGPLKVDIKRGGKGEEGKKKKGGRFRYLFARCVPLHMIWEGGKKKE